MNKRQQKKNFTTRWIRLNNVTFGIDKKPKKIIYPKVGEVCPSFDDGKISISRLTFLKIVRKTTMSKIKKEDLELYNSLTNRIVHIDWLFPRKTRLVYVGIDSEGTKIHFVKTHNRNWYSPDGNYDLDVTFKKLNFLLEEEDNQEEFDEYYKNFFSKTDWSKI